MIIKSFKGLEGKGLVHGDTIPLGWHMFERQAIHCNEERRLNDIAKEIDKIKQRLTDSYGDPNNGGVAKGYNRAVYEFSVMIKVAVLMECKVDDD